MKQICCNIEYNVLSGQSSGFITTLTNQIEKIKDVLAGVFMDRLKKPKQELFIISRIKKI